MSEPFSPSVSELSEFLLGILGHSDNTAAAFRVCENIPSQNVQGNHIGPRQMMHHGEQSPFLLALSFVGCSQRESNNKQYIDGKRKIKVSSHMNTSPLGFCLSVVTVAVISVG